MLGIIQQEPVERIVLFPLDVLTEFAAHEHELLARMRILKCVEQP